MNEVFILAGALLVCVIGIALLITDLVRRRLCGWCGFWYTRYLGADLDGYEKFFRCRRCEKVTRHTTNVEES